MATLSELQGIIDQIKSPGDWGRQEAEAAHDRYLKDIQTRSEAFYKTELGRSEIADRGADAQAMARMNKAMSEAPKREDYVDPTLPAGEQKQAIQNWMRDYSSFMTSNYPDVAKSLDLKPAVTSSAAAAVDVTTEQKLKQAQAEQQTAEADYYKAGGESANKPLDVGPAELQTAKAALSRAGMDRMFGLAGPDPAAVSEVALRAKELRFAASQAGTGSMSEPLGRYADQAIQEIYSQQQQPATPVEAAQQAQQTSPGMGANPRRGGSRPMPMSPQRRTLDLTR